MLHSEYGVQAHMFGTFDPLRVEDGLLYQCCNAAMLKASKERLLKVARPKSNGLDEMDIYVVIQESLPSKPRQNAAIEPDITKCMAVPILRHRQAPLPFRHCR
jgi:hypothetical protein